MHFTKRIIALVLALVFVFALAACTRTDGDDAISESDSSLEGATVSIIIPSHASWPYEEGWKVWQYASEGSGAEIEIQAIPSSDIMAKLPLLFSTPETLSDLMAFTYKPDTDVYVEQGALIALDDYPELTPNYTAFLDSLPEEERSNLILGRKAYDGKVYYAPVHGAERIQNVRAWLYRRDIFEKHDLETPETMDELYELCVELKKLYPDSYPLCMRSGLGNINVMGPSWRPYFCWDMYYDYNEGKWHYGATEDTLLDIITYLKKFIDEGLIPGDFLTINANTWQELVTTDRGFIMPEYQTRIDFFNPLGRQVNPEFDLTACVPPYVENGTGRAMVNKYNYDPKGLVICNTGDQARIENAVRFVDWMYSDEAVELLSWGKEGETYEVVDGKKRYILDEAGNSPQSLYGFQTYGSYQRLDPAAAEAISSDDLNATTDMALEHTEPNVNPTLWIAFDADERAVLEEYGAAVKTYAEEMISKFLLGQEPLSKWDEFQQGLKDSGVEELLAAYDSALKRAQS